jgi:hypothetical protein
VPSSARAVWLGGLALLALLALAVPRRPRAQLLLASSGLALAVLYGGGMVALGRVAPDIARARLEAAGVTHVERVMTAPLPARPLVWEALAETDTGYRWGRLHWLDGGALMLDPRTLPRLPDTDVVRAAVAAESVAGSLEWMRFPWGEVRELPDGWSVIFRDARYVREPIDRGFGTATVRLDSALRPLPAR